MEKNILGLSDEATKVLSEMYDYLTKTKKLSALAASAVLGNVMLESTFNHNAVSPKGARGVYLLLGDKYRKFLASGLKDDHIGQSEWVIDLIFNGSDSFYKDYDRYKLELKDGWKTKTADGKGWYPVPNDSIRFYQVFFPKEKDNTLPPRREHLVEAINNSKDIPTITELFMNYWERPKENEKVLDLRIKYSEEIYNHFNPKTNNYLTFFNR